MAEVVKKNIKIQGEEKFSGYAIAGFILSFFGILSILGIIFSIIALNQINRHERRGKGLAWAGLIIGIIVFISSIIAIIFYDVTMFQNGNFIGFNSRWRF